LNSQLFLPVSKTSRILVENTNWRRFDTGVGYSSALRVAGGEGLTATEPRSVAAAGLGRSGPHAPEVDVAVIDRKGYTRTPTAEDAHAFIEVSDTTYANDKKTKIRLYVAANIPTWHVNIPARLVEFYDRGAALASPRIFRETETINVLGIAIRVTDLFEPQLDHPE
jgi:hypothetical protein